MCDGSNEKCEGCPQPTTGQPCASCAPAPGTPDISVEDAHQAFIDGISSKLESVRLTPEEATAIVIGRAMTHLMNDVAELAMMKTGNPIEDANGALLAEIAEGFVRGFRGQISAMMQLEKRIQVVSRLPRRM